MVKKKGFHLVVVKAELAQMMARRTVQNWDSHWADQTVDYLAKQRADSTVVLKVLHLGYYWAVK